MYQQKKLTQVSDPAFVTICDWYEAWLGRANHESRADIEATMAHSLQSQGLPQTYLIYKELDLVGMYQVAMADDLTTRPNYYPWLINVYVDQPYRGQGAFTHIMAGLDEIMDQLGLTHLYCYSAICDLYEKFGWTKIETLPFPGKAHQMVHVYRKDR